MPDFGSHQLSITTFAAA